MNPTLPPTTSTDDQPTQFPRLSRWFDMLDEAMEIGTKRPDKPRTQEH